MFGVLSEQSERDLRFMAQAFAGPPKPIPLWQKAFAAVIRGFVYVLLSPVILVASPLLLAWWAFDVKDRSRGD